MAQRKIIHTPLGILKGRDCVYLISLSMYPSSVLTLNLGVNPALIKNAIQPRRDSGATSRKLLPLTINFSGVGGFRSLELETWEHQNEEENALIDSSFEEVTESPWIAKLHDATGEYQPMVKAHDRHLELLTYDHVIDVICTNFDYKCNDNA